MGTINLNNGRSASLKLFGKDVKNICPKNFDLGQNNLKVYFLILTSLPKMLQVLLPLPLFLVSFFKGKDFLKNCTVTPKKLATLSRAPPHTADSLHTRITVFRGFQREY